MDFSQQDPKDLQHKGEQGLDEHSHQHIEKQHEAKNPAESQNSTEEKFRDLAKGAIYGAFIGDAIGAFLEFQGAVSEEEVEEAMKMPGGGPFRIGPGQVTDDSELAQSLMHGLREGKGDLDLNLIAQYYGRWYDSGPFDIGITIRNAVKSASEAIRDGKNGEVAKKAREGANKSQQSQSNGSLMRITPLAVWASKLELSDLKKAVYEEVRLTHPNRVAIDAGIIYVAVIQHLLNNPGDNKGAFEKGECVANELENAEILDWLDELHENRLPEANKLIGWLKIAFLHALYYLRENYSYEKAMREMLAKAGDTDTNLAIVGGVLGALHGFSHLNPDHIDKVMSKDLCVERPRHWHPAKHLEAGIEDLIKIRPIKLSMKHSEIDDNENASFWKGTK